MTRLVYKGKNVTVPELVQMLDWFNPDWRLTYGSEHTKIFLVHLLFSAVGRSALAHQFFGDDLAVFRRTLLRWLVSNDKAL